MSQKQQQQLDTHDACRYLWIVWRIFGMKSPTYATHHWRFWRRSYSLLIHFFFSILIPLHFIIDLVFNNDFMSIIKNLTVTIPALFTTLKQAIIYYYSQTELQQARIHLYALDRKAEGTAVERRILERAVRLSHWIFFIYIGLYLLGLFIFATIALMRHTLTFEGWFPFDWSKTETAYLLAFSYQVVGLFTQIIQSIANDIYPLIYLFVLMEQLRVLNMRIARIGMEKEDEKEDSFPQNIQQENYEKLLSCVADHKECMRYFECLRPIISGTMFLQFLVTAFVICIAMVEFFHSSGNVGEVLRTSIYLICILCQVLPCCWLVNQLITETSNLTTALYSCNWYGQDQRFRKAIIIFMQRSQNSNILLAGNLAPITLQTFIAIIRLAFSMFTILNNIKTEFKKM